VFSFFINPWLCIFFMLSLYDKVFSVPMTAQNQGVRCLHLETDCQVCVSLCANRVNQRSEITSLLQQMDDLS
jgi:hypothetical protein